MAGEPSLRGFATRLWRLADLIQSAEPRRSFRAKAYRAAVWSLDDLSGIEAAEEELLATPGIGPGVTALLREYRSEGHIGQLISLELAYPVDSPDLRVLPRMNPRMLRDLKSMGIETRSDLGEAIDSGAVAGVRGAGRQTLDLWRRVLSLPPSRGSIPSYRAWVTAIALSNHIARHTGSEIVVAGATRRVEEWVDRIELVAVTDQPERLREFVTRTASFSSSETGAGPLRGVAHSGIPIIIRETSPGAAGTTLIQATGPEEHARLITEAFPTERDAYQSAGLPFIPPGARVLPTDAAVTVVTVEDLKGDLHVHSELSPDGRMPPEDVVQAARTARYEYIAITDHTQGLRFGGLDEAAISSQSSRIEEIRESTPDLVIFHGAELNIGKDGDLDLASAALESLDFAVAGVHSHFGLETGAQTKRIVTALRHPVVKVLAHPSGRRIGIRPPLDLDMEAVIEAAVASGVALEVNGHRDRLDLSAAWISTAGDMGAVFASNSDAHRPGEFDNVANAVATLQKGGIPAERVINAWPATALVDWIRR